MKKIQLNQCAEIRSGLVISRKQSQISNENFYKLLTLKSVNPKAFVDTSLLEDYYATEKLNQDYLTQKDDIIIRVTNPYTAVLIDETTKGLVIPSHFTVIRTNKKVLSPQYLYWLLNTEKTYKVIQKNNFGNALGSVRPQFFSEMEISLLPIDEQQKIATLNTLFKQEQNLLNLLAEQKELKAKITINQYYRQLRGKK